MEARQQDLATSVGLLVLRLGTGGYMLTHGAGKVQMMVAGEFAKFADPIGLGSPLSLVLMVIAEFLCAAAVILGAATRIAAVPPVVAMAVAAFAVHAADPWTMGEGARLFMAGEAGSWASKEPALLFLTAFAALIFAGAGRFSVDGLVWPRVRERRARRRAAGPGKYELP